MDEYTLQEIRGSILNRIALRYDSEHHFVTLTVLKQRVEYEVQNSNDTGPMRRQGPVDKKIVISFKVLGDVVIN